MENIKSFSFKRIFLLMRKTLYENAKSVIIGTTTLFGIFSFVLFTSALNDGDAWSKPEVFYFIGLAAGAVFVAGTAFTDFRNKEKTLSYLTLPASPLEKLVSELLLVTLFFFVFYTILFYVFNTLIVIAGNYLNIDTGFANIFKYEYFKEGLKLLIFQSVFLAGAATFRKTPFFKTIFVMFLFGIFMIVYVSVLMYFAKNTIESLGSNVSGISEINLTNPSYPFEGKWILDLIKFMFYFLTMPAFWLYTYFKLKEKEA